MNIQAEKAVGRGMYLFGSSYCRKCIKNEIEVRKWIIQKVLKIILS